jgi:hypothetical protein
MTAATAVNPNLCVAPSLPVNPRNAAWRWNSIRSMPNETPARPIEFVVNKGEAETVRTIFRRYLDLQSLNELVVDPARCHG